MSKKPKTAVTDFMDELSNKVGCQPKSKTETHTEEIKSRITRVKGAKITAEMLDAFIQQTEQEDADLIADTLELYKGYGRPDGFGAMPKISVEEAAYRLGITEYEFKRLAEYLEPFISELRDDTTKLWYKNIRKAMGVDVPNEPRHN